MSAECHRHEEHHHQHHHHGHAPARFGRAFALGIGLNGALVTAEVIGGLAAHSVALLADAMHNAGDVLALVLAWGAALLSRRLPSLRRTYGWGRSSILAAFFNAMVVLIGAGAIGLEAMRRMFAPAPVRARRSCGSRWAALR
jgi:cobalt-zinc-cadmium efflux system protein